MYARVAGTTLLAAALLGAAPAACPAADMLPDFSLNRLTRISVHRTREDNTPPVPPPEDTGHFSGLWRTIPRLDGGVKVAARGASGRAEITFPPSYRGGDPAGYRTSVFVRLSGGEAAPVLSWASVLCAGGRYLGYKGAALRLSAAGGVYAISDEALALGPLKARLRVTHPWLGADAPLDDLCSKRAAKKYQPSSLPGRSGEFLFNYDGAKGSLAVSWGK